MTTRAAAMMLVLMTSEIVRPRPSTPPACELQPEQLSVHVDPLELSFETTAEVEPLVACPDVGQPVFIPGSTGTSSFVLGRGAGRNGAVVRHHLPRRELARERNRRALPDEQRHGREAPLAYKDVERVVGVVERAGLTRRVAQLRPMDVMKG